MRGVFGLYGRNLPPFRPNQPIPTASLNVVRESVERARPITGSGSGVQVSQLPNGFSFRTTSPQPPQVMIVSTAVTKKVGGTCGVGKAQAASFVLATKALGAGGGPAVDVYNYHTANGFKVGAVVGVFAWSGVLWCFDIDDCANLS